MTKIKILKLATVYLTLLINCVTFAYENNATSVDSAMVTDNVTVNSIPTNGSETEKSKQPRIIIVGAGLAGIAAAAKLFEAGFQNVTLIEAEDRIGGRVRTTEFGQYYVDIGGQWVHGEQGNAVWDLASPLNLLERPNKPNFGISMQFFDSEGTALDEKTENTLLEFYLKYIQYTPTYSNTPYKSIGDYVEKMFDNVFQNNSKIYKEKRKYLRHFETFRNSLEPAVSWHDVSLDDGGHIDYGGDQLLSWKIRGSSTILDILMKKIPDPEKQLPIEENTIFNAEVSAIDYISNREGPPVLLTTLDGELYEADHVIMTVSLGVLKEKHRSLFIPPLPENKVKTIENLGFGNIAKIFVLFDKPFWNLGQNRALFLNFLWNDADKQSMENDTEKSWILGMTSAVTVGHKPNLLLLFVTGESAKFMEELPKEKVFIHTKENLERFFDKSLKISKPLAIVRSQWWSNPHFRGTYSYRSVDSQRARVYPEMLEKPLNRKHLKILFAGEATSENRFATVDGAISSGWKAANRIINHYKNKLPFDY